MLSHSTWWHMPHRHDDTCLFAGGHLAKSLKVAALLYAFITPLLHHPNNVPLNHHKNVANYYHILHDFAKNSFFSVLKVVAYCYPWATSPTITQQWKMSPLDVSIFGVSSLPNQVGLTLSSLPFQRKLLFIELLTTFTIYNFKPKRR
jgi:hypothetical protein